MIKDKLFYEYIDVKEYKSIIVLNGDLPSKFFFDNNKLPIIAADGAANQLHKLSVKPEIIIGDLDSLDPLLFTDIELIKILDQNTSDFDKACAYADQSKLLPSIVLGVNGGYIDHILNNIKIFTSIGGIFYAPPIVGYVLNNEHSIPFILPINTKISIIGEGIVSTNGLKWELDHTKLSFIGNNACLNRTIQNTISITVHDGICLVMIYLEIIHDAGML